MKTDNRQVAEVEAIPPSLHLLQFRKASPAVLRVEEWGGHCLIDKGRVAGGRVS